MKEVGKTWKGIMKKNREGDERNGQDLERNQLACSRPRCLEKMLVLCTPAGVGSADDSLCSQLSPTHSHEDTVQHRCESKADITLAVCCQQTAQLFTLTNLKWHLFFCLVID